LAALALIAVGIGISGCSTDLSPVGGPNLDSNGISVAGLYSGFYPRSTPGACVVAGSGDGRTLTYVTPSTRSLVPEVLVSVPEYRGPGRYTVGPTATPGAGTSGPSPAGTASANPAALGLAQVTAKLGDNLHWEATGGSVTIEDLGAKTAHGSLAVDLHELKSDGFGDRPMGASGRWSCSI
jgi:fermentation-respiration switch protein FrsA (DUF1100 family)